MENPTIHHGRPESCGPFRGRSKRSCTSLYPSCPEDDCNISKSQDCRGKTHGSVCSDHEQDVTATSAVSAPIRAATCYTHTSITPLVKPTENGKRPRPPAISSSVCRPSRWWSWPFRYRPGIVSFSSAAAAVGSYLDASKEAKDRTGLRTK